MLRNLKLQPSVKTVSKPADKTSSLFTLSVCSCIVHKDFRGIGKLLWVKLPTSFFLKKNPKTKQNQTHQKTKPLVSNKECQYIIFGFQWTLMQGHSDLVQISLYGQTPMNNRPLMCFFSACLVCII